MQDVHTLQSKYERRLAQLKGVYDPQMSEFGWLLQELRWPCSHKSCVPLCHVSVKRLERAWHSMSQ